MGFQRALDHAVQRASVKTRLLLDLIDWQASRVVLNGGRALLIAPPCLRFERIHVDTWPTGDIQDLRARPLHVTDRLKTASVSFVTLTAGWRRTFSLD